MGGRGASSGTSKAGNKYGSQYKTLFTVGNVSFVEKTGRVSETLMETMTEGRVYARVDRGRVKSVVYFDEDKKRSKQIDVDSHHGVSPHVHRGYFHGEYDPGEKMLRTTGDESRMLDTVLSLWENRKKRQ